MATDGQKPGFPNPNSDAAKESRSVVPWIIAGIAVLLVLGTLLALSHHHGPPANPGGAGLAPPDPYAVHMLRFSKIQMSESSSVGGAKVTYLDGLITNDGDQTLTSLTVQVAFRDATNQLVQKETMPLNLIRTHEPYIDTEPVSAAPIGPHETREFRLIFDHVAEGWNQQYPEIRVIEVKSK